MKLLEAVIPSSLMQQGTAVFSALSLVGAAFGAEPKSVASDPGAVLALSSPVRSGLVVFTDLAASQMQGPSFSIEADMQRVQKEILDPTLHEVVTNFFNSTVLFDRVKGADLSDFAAVQAKAQAVAGVESAVTELRCVLVARAGGEKELSEIAAGEPKLRVLEMRMGEVQRIIQEGRAPEGSGDTLWSELQMLRLHLIQVLSPDNRYEER